MFRYILVVHRYDLIQETDSTIRMTHNSISKHFSQSDIECQIDSAFTGFFDCEKVGPMVINLYMKSTI